MKNSRFLLITFSLLLFFSSSALGQERKKDLYHPEANAVQDIASLVEQAKKENKHIILQVGGNWCSWCYLFHDFVQENPEIKKIVEQNYLVYHLNYSKENKNETLLAQYQYPQRFGFPVLLILDTDGKLIHTQNSALLEEGKGYNKKKVSEFFNSWTTKALDPASYNK